MQIAGKEIKAETVTMWLNIVGFFISLVFYLSVEHNIQPIQSAHNPLQDTLLKIDFKLDNEIKSLKSKQDSLLGMLKQDKEKQDKQQVLVNQAKAKILFTIHSDWESLSQKQKEKYTNELITKLKTQHK